MSKPKIKNANSEVIGFDNGVGSIKLAKKSRKSKG